MNHWPVEALWWRKSIPQAFETSRNLMPSASRGRERSARTASRDGIFTAGKAYHLAGSATISPMSRIARLFLPALLLSAAAAVPTEAPSRPLTLEAVKIEPASPRPDTLCHLTVTVKNAGAQTATSLEFVVKINGQELPAYKRRLYLTPVEPGAAREVHLFNFWSTETGRPAPADRRLNVEVTLARASWARKTVRDGAEVWTPAGEVPGLPAAKSLTLTLAK